MTETEALTNAVFDASVRDTNARPKLWYFLPFIALAAALAFLPFAFQQNEQIGDVDLANLFQDAESRISQQPLESIRLVEQGLLLIKAESDPAKLRLLSLQLFAYHNTFQKERARKVTEQMELLLNLYAANYPKAAQIEAYLMLAKSHYATGGWLRSMAHANKALELLNPEQLWLRNELLFLIANAHLGQGNIGQATGLLSQLTYPITMIKSPRNSVLQMPKLSLIRTSLTLLIQLYLQQGQAAGAERSFKQLLLIDENNGQFNALLQTYLLYYDLLKQYGEKKAQAEIFHKAMLVGQLPGISLDNRVALARSSMNVAIEAKNEALARERFYQLKALDQENAFQPLILKSIARFLEYIGANDQAKQMADRFLRSITRESYIAREIAALNYSRIADAIAQQNEAKLDSLLQKKGYQRSLLLFALCVGLTLLVSLIGLSQSNARQHRQTLSHLHAYLDQMGTRDKTTQLLNRRGLMSQMEFEFNKRSNAGKRAALVYIQVKFASDDREGVQTNALDDLVHLVQSLRRHFPFALMARWSDAALVVFTFTDSLSRIEFLAKNWRESFQAQQSLVYERDMPIEIGFTEKTEGMTLTEAIESAENTPL